ncbi:MAG: hypothetical protein M1831_007003 [Alyxoria varia]|nr:MAG: hypothetical protein M1831_007003 [Alyxoria varia]
MKILTPEEEQAHQRATYQGGAIGALGGLAVGAAGVYGASARFPAFRHLTVPFRAFLVTASTGFAGIINADRYSRSFEKSRHADSDFVNTSERAASTLAERQDLSTRAKHWVSEQRYPIVFGSWVLSMALALGIVSRSPHMSASQKLVQARVYAQGLTLAVLVGSFALESNDLRTGKGRWETVTVLDESDPERKRLVQKQVHHERYTGEDQWMDMIESQERKMKQKGEKVYGKGDAIHDLKKQQKASGEGGGKDGDDVKAQKQDAPKKEE